MMSCCFTSVVGSVALKRDHGPVRLPGISPTLFPGLRNENRHFLGHDFNIDWNPRPGWGPDQGIVGNPIHQIIMKSMGVDIVENLDLERAVETARRLKRYEFMITFAPLPVEGGTGSPVNPLAIF